MFFEKYHYYLLAKSESERYISKKPMSYLKPASKNLQLV